jgi:hypothetical protein
MLFPAQEHIGTRHEESSGSFSFGVKPHSPSVKVWEIPSPIALGDEFSINVGIRCSAECKLTGQPIETYDHDGVKVATSTLDDDIPWSGVIALSGVEVKLKAPTAEGRYRWTVKFPAPELELPHEEASCTFAFGVAKRPEPSATLETMDQAGEAPTQEAQVRTKANQP